MSKKRQTIDYFDDNFEVIYTDELPDVSLDFDEYSDDSDDDYTGPDSRYDDNYNDDTDYDDDYDDDDYDDDDYDNDDYDDDDYNSSNNYQYRQHRKRSASPNRNIPRPSPQAPPARKKKNASTNLASPLQGPVRTTTKLVEKLTYFILRPAPAVLAGIITLITVFTFWTGHSAYGELPSIAGEGNYTLAAYLIVGGILAYWEVCSFLFALSGLHSGTGRGLTFFILVYIGSYAASVAGSLIPESVPDFLLAIEGIKGGLASFGSLYSMFFPLCVAGLVTCILKNIFSD